MLPDDFKDYLRNLLMTHYHIEDEEEKQSTLQQKVHNKRESFRLVSQQMDVYLDGEDLILKSPIVNKNRRSNTMQQLQQNRKVRNLTEIRNRIEQNGIGNNREIP